MKVQSATIHCAKCDREFETDLPTHCAVEVFCAAVDAVRCPDCGAKTKDLSLVRTQETT